MSQKTCQLPASVWTADLTKTYGNVVALDGVSITAPRGTITGILGPQRSGKTTLLNVLAGLARPTSGDATLQGTPVSARGYGGSPRVGALVDPYGFYPSLSGRRNLELLCLLGRMERGHASDWIDRLELTEVADQPYRTYSRGTRQRLGIASALLGSPALILLDEPANGLDPDGIWLLNQVLRSEATRGASVLMATHLLLQAEQVCDRLILLASGECVYQGTMRDFSERHGGLADAENLDDVFFRLLGDRQR